MQVCWVQGNELMDLSRASSLDSVQSWGSLGQSVHMLKRLAQDKGTVVAGSMELDFKEVRLEMHEMQLLSDRSRYSAVQPCLKGVLMAAACCLSSESCAQAGQRCPQGCCARAPLCWYFGTEHCVPLQVQLESLLTSEKTGKTFRGKWNDALVSVKVRGTGCAAGGPEAPAVPAEVVGSAILKLKPRSWSKSSAGPPLPSNSLAEA